MLIPFPFEDGQAVFGDEESQLALQRCFVDAAIHLDGKSVSEDQWPSIGEFETDGRTLRFSVKAAGEKVRIATTWSSSVRFPTEIGASPWGYYVITLSSEGIKDLCESRFPHPVSGSSSPSGQGGVSWLRLCAKCVTVTPESLSSIRVFDGVNPKADGPHFVLRGDVSVRPGNNMQLTEQEDGGIVLNAVPGAGFGIVPCVCDNAPSGDASSLAGPDGHVRLLNDTCYDIEPRVETVVENGVEVKIGTLQIHHKCTACCTCEMYESIVTERLKPLADAIRSAKADMRGYLSDYENAVRAFNQRIARPTLADLSLSLSGMPVGGNISPKLSGTNIKGRMGRCAFTAILRNSSYFEVHATLQALSGTNSVVESSASWSDEDGSPKSKTSNSAGGMIGYDFVLYPGRSLAITYVSMKSEMVGAPTTGGYAGSVTFSLKYKRSDGTLANLGALNKTVEV